MTSPSSTVSCLAVLSISVVTGSILYSPLDSSDRKCVGSIGLYKDSALVGTFSDSEEAVWEEPNRAVLQGCGCFVLFHKKKGEGDQFYVPRVGEHDIPLKRVRSIYRVKCREEQVPWATLVIVVIMATMLASVVMVSLVISKRLAFVQ